MSGPIRKIEDAIELLAVVEQLTDSFGRRENESSVPWRGIQLTLKNVKELLVGANTALHREFERKKPAPETGSVRELPQAPQPAAGMFTRVVLPKEEPPAKDPLEH